MGGTKKCDCAWLERERVLACVGRGAAMHGRNERATTVYVSRVRKSLLNILVVVCREKKNNSLGKLPHASAPKGFSFHRCKTSLGAAVEDSPVLRAGVGYTLRFSTGS
jgi:hypothetical protein